MNDESIHTHTLIHTHTRTHTHTQYYCQEEKATGTGKRCVFRADLKADGRVK